MKLMRTESKKISFGQDEIELGILSNYFIKSIIKRYRRADIWRSCTKLIGNVSGIFCFDIFNFGSDGIYIFSRYFSNDNPKNRRGRWKIWIKRNGFWILFSLLFVWEYWQLLPEHIVWCCFVLK